jgi:hypothetical protein
MSAIITNPSEQFRDDNNHPLGQQSLTGADKFPKKKGTVTLKNGVKLEQDGGGDDSFEKNHTVNNVKVYSPRTNIVTNGNDDFSTDKVYTNYETIVGTTIKKLEVGGGTGDKLAIKILTGSHSQHPHETSHGVTSVNALGLILPTHRDPEGKARILEVEGKSTSEYRKYSLNGGHGQETLNGKVGFTLHHDFGADQSLYNSDGNLTDKHIRLRIVTYVASDTATRVTHTYVDPDGKGFQPYYTILDSGEYIPQKEARIRGSVYTQYRRDGVYDLQDEYVIRPIIPPQ